MKIVDISTVTTPLQQKQLQRIERSFRSVNVDPADNDGIVITISAYRFAPALFDRIRAELLVDIGREDLRVHGLIHYRPLSSVQGIRYSYEFVPDDQLVTQRIIFYGNVRWSNVRTVFFGEPISKQAKNPFYREATFFQQIPTP